MKSRAAARPHPSDRVAEDVRPRPPKGPRVNPEYVLRLFVSGFTARSQRAIDNLQHICKRYLAGRYRIEVVDLHQSPDLARDQQIIATPTLLKMCPSPARRVIGDLSQVDKVLHGLEIP